MRNLDIQDTRAKLITYAEQQTLSGGNPMLPSPNPES